MVSPLTARGVAVAIVGYDIAPKGKEWPLQGSGQEASAGAGESRQLLTWPELSAGTLDLMVDQVARSVAFVQKQYPSNQWVSLQMLPGPRGWRVGRDRTPVNPKDAACLI